MTGVLITAVIAYAAYRWFRYELDHAQTDDLMAVANAVGVVPEQDPSKVAAVREALRQEALVLAHVRRDLTDARIAEWLESAK